MVKFSSGVGYQALKRGQSLDRIADKLLIWININTRWYGPTMTGAQSINVSRQDS
jgi:hypothetical protein